jgi:hypothetical protein
MLPSSIPIILMTALFTAGAVALLALVWRKGFMRDFDAQARSIFDERDFRIARPWEGPVDQLEREMRFGTPLAPTPGEWGDAEPTPFDVLSTPRPRDDAPPPPSTPRRRPA